MCIIRLIGGWLSGGSACNMGLPGSVDGQESPGAASTLLSTAEPSSGLADPSQSKRQAASAESASQEMPACGRSIAL